jgi:hypothetical protein
LAHTLRPLVCAQRALRVSQISVMDAAAAVLRSFASLLGVIVLGTFGWALLQSSLQKPLSLARARTDVLTGVTPWRSEANESAVATGLPSAIRKEPRHRMDSPSTCTPRLHGRLGCFSDGSACLTARLDVCDRQTQ